MAESAGPLTELAAPSGPAARLTGGARPADPPTDALLAGASGSELPPPDVLSGHADPLAGGPPDVGALDRAGAARQNQNQTAPGDVPEVELSEAEVAEVLSGRVIPIGAFFGGADETRAAKTDDEIAAPPGATFLADVGRIAGTWARDRHLGLTSASGICVALAVSAAAWFSAGTRTDIIRGVAALWIGYLILRAGQFIAHQAAEAETGLRALQASAEAAAGAGASTGSSDASYSGVTGPGPVPPRSADSGFRRLGPTRWLAALGTAAAECGVYAGLAVGAVAERWGAVWPLAIAVLSLVAVRNLMTACSTPPGLSEQSGGVIRRLATALLTMPVGGRVLLVGVVAPFWGARAALLALLDWAIISIGYGLAGRVAAGLTGDVTGATTGSARRGGQPRAVSAPSKLVRLRDDGALARALGVLVRGALMPLPPAILGLAAVCGLAVLGLHGLPGVLLIAPAVVMLLAAPGSAHPHGGRFDWLVPVLLLGAQCLYLAATGLAARVPGAVIFALIGAVMLRYTDLAWPDRPVQLARRRDPGARPIERGTGLGWEGRMLFAGLTAAMGVATVAYIALTAYLVVLICAKVVTTYLAPEAQGRE